jgi:hypothetical protein
MDCVDCHNRPSHIYHSPDYAVDQALATGLMPRDLPEVKRVAVEAMTEEYETEDQALSAIAEAMMSYYDESYPDLVASDGHLVSSAIEATQGAFAKNIFPEMKVRWEYYPLNTGHFESPGCMRCHEGLHVSDDGEKTISHDCTACHVILGQGTGDRATVSSGIEGLEFEHPEDIDEAWREMGCYECHTGTQP